MARFAFKAGEEYALKLSKIATNSEAIAKKAIYVAAKIVADQIKSNLEGVLSPDATGELVDSFGIAKIDRDDDGNWNTKLGFDGYDSKGVANQLKARILESGTSTKQKKPFVRPALQSTKKRAQAAMEKVIEDEIKKIGG